MKTSLLYSFTLASVLALSSCYTWQPPQRDPRGNSLNQPADPNRYMDGPGGTQYVDPSQPPLDPSQQGYAGQNPPPQGPGGTYLPPQPIDPGAVQPPMPQGPGNTFVPPTPPPVVNQPPVQTTPPPVIKPGAPPYGIKVPGKTGFVYSPFDKTAGIVDVQGMAPGTKVKCPYTGKVFIVP